MSATLVPEPRVKSDGRRHRGIDGSAPQIDFYWSAFGGAGRSPDALSLSDASLIILRFSTGAVRHRAWQVRTGTATVGPHLTLSQGIDDDLLGASSMALHQDFSGDLCNGEGGVAILVCRTQSRSVGPKPSAA